ncbi:MFS transporter [Microbacterium sp. NPDC079995]|uniref:MFS transporter n=1 Tax=unclassified Microbacterium TaxID=2609290 RepID=UPI00344C4858
MSSQLTPNDRFAAIATPPATPTSLPGTDSTAPAPETISDPSRWLWVIYPLAMVAMNAVWGGVMQMLLGKQVAQLLPEPAAAAGVLGLTLTVAAVSSVISQPILGRLSDRTRTRFLGRRNIWILIGGIVSAIGLIVMSQLTSIVAIAVVWAIMMWPLNATQAGLTAVLPERIPLRRRGTMSGMVGASTLVGLYAGVALAGLSQEVFKGYLLIAAAFLLTAVTFALTTKDRPAPDLRALSREERRERTRMPSFRTAPDYWWTFAGRAFLIFGYFSVTSFQLYILRDYIGVGDIDQAGVALVAISGMSTLLSLVFAAIGGWVSDKFGRLRIFVALSTAMFAPAGLVYLLMPTMTGAWIASAIVGAAFGVYMAVDQALITRVLPNLDNAARDLGIMNIANAGPQIVAPAVVGAIVGATGNYQVIFIILIASTVLGALSVRFIRGVR